RVQAGEGYWIYMKEQGTLAGFSYTPVADVPYEIPLSAGIFMSFSNVNDGVPALPAAFTGNVMDKAGNPISEGKIEVVIDGVVRASKAFTDGQFGLSLGERLIVEKMYYANAGEITFVVNGYDAAANPPIEWAKASGNLTELNLVVDTDIAQVFCYKTVALTSPNVVELSFSKELKNNLADNNALKQAISYSSADDNFNALNEADTISIEGNKLIITFASAVRGDDNQIRIEANALSDMDGNVIMEPIVTPKFTAQVVDECFIATASFGSKFEPAVVLLRVFRDQYLLTNTLGTAFVEFYYQHSPPVAAFIADSEPLKAIVRIILLPFIAIVYSIYHPWFLTTLILGIFALLFLRRRTHQV
ncbi:MAG: CFI-box-CTERM domain-containing protein, partial [Syntrophomonadaceae bacterium]